MAPAVGIVDAALRFSKFKEKDMMGKNLRGTKKARISGIAKLDDANKAGSAEGYKCTLILTEVSSSPLPSSLLVPTIPRHPSPFRLTTAILPFLPPS